MTEWMAIPVDLNVFWSVVVGIAGWYLIGTVVLSAIDADGRLLEWAKALPLLRHRRTPGIGVFVVAMTWPVVWWAYRRNR